MHDWHQFHAAERQTPEVVDPRRRLRFVRAALVALLAVVFLRAVQLEWSHGDEYRREACEPLRRERSLPGVRGRILARDGTVLASDREVLAVAVHYRWLQDPPDARWLRYTARQRLPRAERKDPERLAAAEAALLVERAEVAERLAALCGVSPDVWNARAARIQTRVERIAEGVNRRAEEARLRERIPEDAPATLPEQLGRRVWDALESSARDGSPRRITVAEEVDYHVVVEDVPLSVAAEIEGNPEHYPGATIVERSRRRYPSGSLAAHVLGHLGPLAADELRAAAADGYEADDLVGRAGLERQYERLLRGRHGAEVELTDRSGRVTSRYRQREPEVGRDLVLTLDAPLQRVAEQLLDEALARRALDPGADEPAGGAAVVMDVHRGAILAAASAPRFDPNWFLPGGGDELQAAMSGAAHPMFDRAARMALPPGSLFKIVTAVALLESGAFDPDEPLDCPGYLREPDRHRCAIYARHGVGHGAVNLSDALCQSCNVFFFHHAETLGPLPLVDWALKLGFGRATGVDLPGEAAGMVPTPATIRALEGHDWRPGDTLALAIGQGSTGATPLQVARLTAAVANGGRLVTPHLVARLALAPRSAHEPTSDVPAADDDADEESIRVPPPRPIPDLTPATLDALRRGLRRVVADPDGTAHGTVFIETLPIAGKTGTAETGGDRAPHAWFAGYLPADEPKYVLVVVLEHGGDGGTAAGAVARRLALGMRQLAEEKGSELFSACSPALRKRSETSHGAGWSSGASSVSVGDPPDIGD